MKSNHQVNYQTKPISNSINKNLITSSYIPLPWTIKNSRSFTNESFVVCWFFMLEGKNYGIISFAFTFLRGPINVTNLKLLNFDF